MIHDILRNQSAIDLDAFTQITRHYGYAEAACYRLTGKNLVLIHGTQVEGQNIWPPAALFSSDYTPKKGSGFPLGWIKPSFGPETRKLWPKGVSFYFPAQDWSSTRIIFVVKNASGKRTKVGELDGPLEALTGNICNYIDQGELRHFISEAHINEQMEKMTQDLQIMSDHEIRNPLTAVLGFGELLPGSSEEELEQYRDTIVVETGKALEALDKIKQALHFSPSDDEYAQSELQTVQMDQACEKVSEQVREEFAHLAPGVSFQVSLRKPSEVTLEVSARQDMIEHAIFEVLKNAFMYSHHGQVNMTMYRSDQWIVVDIEDDGPGVSQGAEELIFLRFFQEPLDRGTRRIKRGLGTGLYMARYIVEQHGGTLKFIRGAGKHGIFRFMLPVRAEDDLSPLVAGFG